MLLSPVYARAHWIAMNCPLESRSFTMGIYETVFGLGMIVGPIAAASMLILPLSIGLD